MNESEMSSPKDDGQTETTRHGAQAADASPSEPRAALEQGTVVEQSRDNDGRGDGSNATGNMHAGRFSSNLSNSSNPTFDHAGTSGPTISQPGAGLSSGGHANSVHSDTDRSSGDNVNADKANNDHSVGDGGSKSSGSKGKTNGDDHGGFHLTHFVDERLSNFSLSLKLVACTVVLLLLGAAGISVSIRQFVGSYLIQKTDSQLSQQAELVYKNIAFLSSRDNSRGSTGLTDYFLQIRDTNNKITHTPLIPVLKGNVISVPQLPPNGQIGDVQFNKPFTTPATVTLGTSTPSKSVLQAASANWRVLALPLVAKIDDTTTEPSGMVYIGLSLSDQIDTVNTLTRHCIVVGLIIVFLGAAIATFLIQGTLYPLKRIEKTAAKIAAGDLSQRVPSAPENTEVGSLAASLNSMLSRIERSFWEQKQTTEKMKRFVSDASHELRTPLATIHGYAELYTMQRDLPGALERADKSIEHIESSSSRMTLLVEDLLSLARLDEGRGIDITQQVPLTSLLRDAGDDLHALDPARHISTGSMQLRRDDNAQLGFAFKPGSMAEVTMTGDGSRLRQVVTNIVGNIHRYTPNDSPVEVALSTTPASIDAASLSVLPSTRKSLYTFMEAAEVGQSIHTGTNYAVISFIDHGPGVLENKQSQIFERFYTADPSRARLKGGTGLGMSIAQSVIKAHHGLISASTTPGGGLTLTVIVPVSRLDEGNHTVSASGKPSKKKRVPKKRDVASKQQNAA